MAHALVMTMSPLVISKALPPCHTERSEVSHNTESTTESKRDFSPFSKVQNDKGGTAQNDKVGMSCKMINKEQYKTIKRII